jgi:3-hydroxyisobutyrate dehydrogenase
LKKNFDPGFFTDHFVKDLGIALDGAAEMNISLPSTSLAHQFYKALQAQGGGKMGTQGILTVYEKLNNVSVK